MAKDSKKAANENKKDSAKKTEREKLLEKRVKELEALVAKQKQQIDELRANRAAVKAALKAPAEKAAKKGKKAVSSVVEKVVQSVDLPVDSEGRAIIKTKRSKYKCATSGKYACDECAKPINRGETIRFVSVKYADGTQERYQFCCGEHRNAYCDGHGIPQDRIL